MRHEVFPTPAQTLRSEPRDRRRLWAALLPQPRSQTIRSAIAIAAGMLDGLAIVAAGLATGALYGRVVHGDVAAVDGHFTLSLIVALFVVVPGIFREEYNVENYLAFTHHPKRLFPVWTLAFLSVLILGFITKTTGEFSRIIAVLFYAVGYAALIGARAAVVAFARHSTTASAASVRRVFLVGFEEDVAAFSRQESTKRLGLRVIGATLLRKRQGGLRKGQLAEDIALAVSTVRFLRPDDVFILIPWSNPTVIERCVDAFLSVPTAVHLRPELVMERFPDLRISRVGAVSSINVARKPLSTLDILAKRSLDLAGASVALLLLAPLFGLVALLIKLDTPGPVLFRQRRYGFNQESFRIFKFRSMTVGEPGPFRQATRDDARVTRVGRFLRRWSIDELPQLLNVLSGEMSLVGPRPHALAHDRAFERRIALYARRHNVKPGITGWAQINGYRGETRTDDDMHSRVAHDLYYIDHWSLWLDLRILALTALSPKVYRNAY